MASPAERVNAKTSDTGFSAEIRPLQDENEKLTGELSNVQDLLQDEAQARRQLEDRVKSSKEDMCTAGGKIEKLKAEKTKLAIQGKKLSRRLSKSEEHIKVAMSAIQKCGPDARNYRGRQGQ